MPDIVRVGGAELVRTREANGEFTYRPVDASGAVVDAAGHGDLALVELKRAARLVDGDERRRAGGLHHDRGAGEAKGATQLGSHHVVGAVAELRGDVQAVVGDLVEERAEVGGRLPL